MTFSTTLNVTSLWSALRAEAEACICKENLLARMVQSQILEHGSFELALACTLAAKLSIGDSGIGSEQLFSFFKNSFAEDANMIEAAKLDLLAILERDPAATNIHTPFLHFKGYHALQTHRLAHHAWKQGRQDLAYYLQGQSSLHFQVDIHPASDFGVGIMMDHATGIVIGETAVVEDDVSMLHGVTLGGTGKEGQDRHPKVRKGALIGAGAIIIGNIEIGEGARVGAGSVVLHPVPPHKTVAGIPARVIGEAGCAKPGTVMDHILREFPETQVHRSQ